MDNTTNTTPVTLESIAQKKSHAATRNTTPERNHDWAYTRKFLLRWNQLPNKANAMMRAFNTGMAVFDGIVLGVKVMKKFRKIFGRKR